MRTLFLFLHPPAFIARFDFNADSRILRHSTLAARITT